MKIEEFDINKVYFSSNKMYNDLIRVSIFYEGQEEFIIQTPHNMTSFGLEEKISEKNLLIGYQLPILLWSKFGIRKEEELFISVINQVTEKARQYLRREFELNQEQLTRLNPIYCKTPTTSFSHHTKSPMLFLKCEYDKTKNEIQSKFVNEVDRKEVNPLMCLHKKMNTTVSIKIDNILISSSKINIQLKLRECHFKLPMLKRTSLLCPLVDLMKIEKV